MADQAYKGIIEQFVSENPDGTLNLNQICRSAGLSYGLDGSFNYYVNEEVVSNDGKGVGPFITASVEIHKLMP
ncbi:MAG: glycoside hydrolase family 88 protein [candidate division KSB1 bacterium]|nr:glycoside hydrolase family 88 protein [candidate division KSB1 bacterium]